MTAPTYLFRSERLGFRNWHDSDLPLMAAINADPEVMKHFPSTRSLEETATFITRMQQLSGEKGFCYFAVDVLGTGEFIGFTGLAVQTFVTDFTPCTDIGWRLKKEAWGKGYATEGAARCLRYAFDTLQLGQVLSMAPQVNTPSIRVMQKIGMQYVKHFTHPLLDAGSHLQPCVLYGYNK